MKQLKPTQQIEDGWDGVLTMQYKKRVRDTLYYDVVIEHKGKRVEIVLPRYAPMIGWIEVFGLPPQNEWVILDQEKNPFSASGNLRVRSAGKQFLIREKIRIATDAQSSWRTVSCERKLGALWEVQTYVEDWSTQGLVRKYIHFAHSAGDYHVTLEAHRSPARQLIPKAQRSFFDRLVKERGKPTEVWFKKFSARGAPPPIYYKLFPFWGKEWSSGAGVVLEVGYEKETGHGDWYKLFTFNGHSFELKEDNWSSRPLAWKGKNIRLKNTYRKYIRKIS